MIARSGYCSYISLLTQNRLKNAQTSWVRRDSGSKNWHPFALLFTNFSWRTEIELIQNMRGKQSIGTALSWQHYYKDVYIWNQKFLSKWAFCPSPWTVLILYVGYGFLCWGWLNHSVFEEDGGALLLCWSRANSKFRLYLVANHYYVSYASIPE